jgi:hypothetical protein
MVATNFAMSAVSAVMGSCPSLEVVRPALVVLALCDIHMLDGQSAFSNLTQSVDTMGRPGIPAAGAFTKGRHEGGRIRNGGRDKPLSASDYAGNAGLARLT